MDLTKIEIEDQDGIIVETYYMSKITVLESLTLGKMQANHVKEEMFALESNILVSEQALSFALCNKDGERIYPNNGILKSGMLSDLFQVLSEAYLDTNPPQTTLTLTAKKKKS